MITSNRRWLTTLGRPDGDAGGVTDCAIKGSSARRCCEGGSVTLPLSPDLRARLGAVIQEARRVAESGAGEVLAALAVGDARPFDSMSLGEKAFRNALRARGRQAGDRMVSFQ